MATQELSEAGASGSVGMPQLDFSTFPNQIFWLVITLIVIYFILSRVALPRIGRILIDRSDAINSDLAAAEDFKAQAQEAEAAYDQALADARAKAQLISAEARAEIKADLDAQLATADAEIAARVAQSNQAIEEMREGALKSVEAISKEIANEVLVAIGGDAADAKTINSAVAPHLRG